MKFKSVIIACLFLAILTIGAVSAADENMTSDNLAVELSDESEITSDDSSGENEMFNVTVPDEIRQETSFEVTFSGPADLNGYIETQDSNDEFEANSIEEVNNGTATLSLYISSPGMHEILYKFSDDTGTRYSSSFNVYVSNMFDISVPEEIKAGLKFKATFTCPDNLNGSLEVVTYLDDDEDYTYAEVTNGKAEVYLVASSAGMNTYDYSFYSDEFEFNGVLKVNALNLFTVAAPKSVYQGNKVTITFTGPSNLNGYIDINWDEEGVEFDRFKVKSGKATATVTVPKVKEIWYSFTSSDGKTSCDAELAIEVLKKPIIKANDFKKDYSSKKKYQVRILDKNGKSVGAGKKVTFNFYKGSKKVATKTAKTDKNGYAKIVNFNEGSGIYKVKISYGPATVTKKYTINSILKLKNDKRKDLKKNMHVSSKIVWSAYLKKVDGKYLKGKKLKFTVYKQVFKGEKTYISKVKTFTLKTNKKGVATITFKNCPVKVSDYYMRMGVPFYVKITYGKDRLLGGDVGDDPYFSVYSKYPYKYYFGPGWHAS